MRGLRSAPNSSVYTKSHTHGGLTVQQDVGVLAADSIKILPKGGLAAHSAHQRYLHAGKLDVRGHEVHTLRVMQDTIPGGDGLIVRHLAHRVREDDGQGVRLWMAQADDKAGLRGHVNQQNLLSSLGQSHAEIYTTCRFSHTALLIDQGDDLGVHGSRPPYKNNQWRDFPYPIFGKEKGHSITGTPSKSKADICF